MALLGTTGPGLWLAGAMSLTRGILAFVLNPSIALGLILVLSAIASALGSAPPDRYRSNLVAEGGLRPPGFGVLVLELARGQQRLGCEAVDGTYIIVEGLGHVLAGGEREPRGGFHGSWHPSHQPMMH